MTDSTDDPPPDVSPARPPAPGWSQWSEAPAIVMQRGHLTRTLSVAVVVGTILFLINQLDVVMSGAATTRTWIKAVITYVVPFFVANYGVLTATRRPADDNAEPRPS